MISDIRFAFRQILQKPWFALTAVAILALGIGSSAAVFSALYQVLLKPLPYPDARELVFVHNAFPASQVAVAGVSGFDYAEVRRQRQVFSDAGVFFYNDLTLTGFGDARHIDVVNASASLFDTFGVKAAVGRTFSEAEDQFGAAKTVVLSDAFWRSTFAGDAGVVGRVIHLDGKPYSVIGVMPAAFQFPSPETQLWIPVGLRAGEFTIQGGRLEKWLHMVARIAPGIDGAKANAALQSIGAGLGAALPMFYPVKAGWHFTARPLVEEQTEHYRGWLCLAFGAVLAVLLIAWINVGGLLVIRASARRGELAVRLAMGASKPRLARQMLAETGVLAFAGCGIGLLLAAWAVRLINVYGPLPQPASIGTWTAVFVFGLGLLTTVGAGLPPAMVSARMPVNEVLKSKASRTATRGWGWRNAIVPVQIGLAVVLIFTATLLSRSFLNLTRVPAGFDGARVWTGSIQVPGANFRPYLNAFQALPGVESASLCGALPFNPSGVWTERLRFPERAPANPQPEAQIGLATPGYFEAMRIPVRAGRVFGEQDRTGAPRVAVIDEELARRYFAGRDPIGRKVRVGGSDTDATIVGIVGPVHNGDLGGPVAPQIYLPAWQERSETMYVVLRMKDGGDPTAAVRTAIANIDRSVALYDVAFMDARVVGSLRLRRFIAFLLSGFAVFGMALAAVGLYASLGHLVEMRRREIGIRVAVGARQGQILRQFLTRGGVVTCAGMALGIGAAVVVGKVVRSQLFGVATGDVGTWAVVVGLVMAGAAVAVWVPAWRAAGVDPMVALREE